MIALVQISIMIIENQNVNSLKTTSKCIHFKQFTSINLNK